MDYGLNFGFDEQRIGAQNAGCLPSQIVIEKMYFPILLPWDVNKIIFWCQFNFIPVMYTN